MKKNYSLRIAGFLLVLVLLSTCLISGTFAKYTTNGSGTDNARVAKWGVTIVVEGSKAFEKNYQTNDSQATAITNSVSATNDKVLAPGTKGTLFTVKTEGTPEVAVKAKANFSLTLTGWNINSDEYCPLEFTVAKGNNENSKEFKIGNEDGEYNSIEALVEALKNYIEAGNKNYDPNANLLENEDLNLTVTWEWAFEGNDDTKDTALGDLKPAPTISFSYELTLTQID